jgi:hypothetical protein
MWSVYLHGSINDLPYNLEKGLKRLYEKKPLHIAHLSTQYESFVRTGEWTTEKFIERLQNQKKPIKAIYFGIMLHDKKISKEKHKNLLSKLTQKSPKNHKS